jgi:hypothetical protein
MAPKRRGVYSLECGMLHLDKNSALRTSGMMLNLYSFGFAAKTRERARDALNSL